MKILHVTPSFFPATAFGGPTEAEKELCDALATRADVSLRVLTTDTSGPGRLDRLSRVDQQAVSQRDFEITYASKTCGKDVSISLVRALGESVRWADIVHLVAVYSFPTIPSLIVCAAQNKPVVWTTFGSLIHWEKTTRRGVKFLWDRGCSLFASSPRVVFHVTSAVEAAQNSLRFPGIDTRLIPHGVSIPPDPETRPWLPNGVPRLLFLGRLDPIKGIDRLLRAVSNMREPVMLTVAGNGSYEYSRSLAALSRTLGIEDRVRFVGHVEPAAKTALFRETDLTVMPSFTENFGLSVAESLAHGIPVVVSNGTPWERVHEHGCGWWIDNTPEAIVDAVRQARSTDLEAMGRRGRTWMAREFSWDHVADATVRLYAERLGVVG